MKDRKSNRIFISCLAFIWLLGMSAGAQDTAPKKPSDPELDRIEAIIRQAQQESEQFMKSGGKASDATHPNRKSAATLWQYRTEHPGTPAAARATGESLHLLFHADQISEMQSKIETLKLDDAAWKQVLNVLMEFASSKNDYAYFINKAQTVLQQTTDPEIKLRARFTLAQVYAKKGDLDQAKAAYQAVIAEYPKTPQAKEAEGNLLELETLNLGQPAPLFASRGANGDPVSLADFKGKVVLLEFWASWCSTCVADIPHIKELYAQYKDQGFAIIGISLDDDPKALQEMLTAKGVPWAQIRNGREGNIVKLFNVQGTPTYFLLDRDGKMAAKGLSSKRLDGAIAELLKK